LILGVREFVDREDAAQRRGARRDGIDVLARRRRREEQRRAGRVHDVRDRVVVALDVLERELRRDRHRHDPAHDAAEEGQDELVRIGDGDGDPVALLEAARVKVRRALLGLDSDVAERAEALRAVRPHEDEPAVRL